MSIRRGIRIGVDVGTVRVGVSRCDPDGILTMPVETLHRAPDLSDLDRLADIVRSHGAIEAHARLRASGIPEIEHRSVIDQVAAQIILEQALELERMGGRAPGEEIILEPSEGAHA